MTPKGVWMKNENSSETLPCPLCGAMPEHADSDSIAWSDFCQRHICTQCAMHLSMEVYDRESDLFATAARLLGVDIWECRKRYLEESIARTREQLDHEVERAIIGFLKTGMIRCSAQIEAIEQYLELRKKGVDPDELAEEERKLEEIMFGGKPVG
ncbi:hypothetical protein Ppro_1082 [Pelobacter propionicus DSM 2379]|uniref:Uncharacterized protein n=2 Tax=Pelobacter propionicus TaxID=29543 RepID=A1AMY7_PELPD|nr:hypothetical protein Ppro_1082 [Pelobacter propionicus DSM 2379]